LTADGLEGDESVWAEMLGHYGAELVLLAVAVLILVAGTLVDARREWRWIAGCGIVTAAAVWVTCSRGNDALADIVRPAALLFGGLLMLAAARPLPGRGTAAYLGSLLAAVAGLMLAGGAGDLAALIVGLELVSLAVAVMLFVAVGRRGQAAALRYYLLGSLASALLLLGFGLLYAAAGSTNLAEIRAALVSPGSPAAGFGVLGKLAFAFILVGLGWKITAVPFHLHAADVHASTSHPAAAVLAVLPKAAALVALVRVVVWALPPSPGMPAYAWRVMAVLAAATMTLGNVAALLQRNLRRRLAYVSIAQTGYLLAALSVALVPWHIAGEWGGVDAALLHLVAYAIAMIGTLAALDYLGRDDRPIEILEQFAGLGRTRRLPAAAIALCTLSLAGAPLLAGYWGMSAVLTAALQTGFGPGMLFELRLWYITLASAIGLNVLLGAVCHSRIIVVMYFRTPLGVPKPQGGPGAWAAMVVSAMLIVIMGMFASPLIRQAHDAGREGDAPAHAPDYANTAVPAATKRDVAMP